FLQAEDGIRDFHVTGVQTCALPISIIRLPRIVGTLEKDIGGTVILHDKYHIALPVRFVLAVGQRGQTAQVNTTYPILWNGETYGRLPVTFMNIFMTGLRRRLFKSLKGVVRLHQSGTASTIVAGAEDFQFETFVRAYGNHYVDGLTGFYALPRAITFNKWRALLAFVGTYTRELPILAALFSVFNDNRILLQGRHARCHFYYLSSRNDSLVFHFSRLLVINPYDYATARF